MKRCYFLIITIAVLFFASPLPANAEVIEWQLFYRDDNVWQEQVAIPEAQMAKPNGWEELEAEEGRLISRQIASGEEYSRLQDRLPLLIKVNDYGLVYKISFIGDDKYEYLDSGIIKQISELGPIRLTINIPAAIMQNNLSGETSEKEVVWTLNKLGDLADAGVIIQAYIISWNVVLSIILVLVILTIMIYFVMQSTRINRLIEDLYSLENVEETERPEGEEEK